MAENMEISESSANGDLSSSNNGQITVNQVKFVGIEYPGYIKDENHMLETLGGEEALSRTYSIPTRRLEMSFRPEDPYAHSLCGDRYPTANLLLKVKRRKKKQKEGIGETEEVKYEQEILGIVGNSFKFEVMADFQYLVPELPDVLKQVTDGAALNQDVPYHLQPPVFTRFDHPINYNYNAESVPRSGKTDQGNDKEEESLVGTRARTRRPVYAIAINFNTPEVPTAANPKAEEIANRPKDGLMDVIKKLFANRPIWSRSALQCHITSASQERMKQLLACTAYYWLNGPWRTLWTRIGYDPRKDPSAKIYQMLDFRVGSRKGAKNLPIKAKRSLSKYVLPNLVRRTNSTQGTLVKEVVMVEGEKKAEEKQNQEPDLPYVFTPNKMPVQKQLFYQVCDLHDPEIQRLLGRNDGQSLRRHVNSPTTNSPTPQVNSPTPSINSSTPSVNSPTVFSGRFADKPVTSPTYLVIRNLSSVKEEECQERDGWCLPGTSDQIRSILYQRTTELAEKLRQEQLGEGTEASVSQLELTGDEWTGHEGVQNYLQMLEQDDDIEAYDIFDDYGEGDD